MTAMYSEYIDVTIQCLKPLVTIRYLGAKAWRVLDFLDDFCLMFCGPEAVMGRLKCAQSKILLVSRISDVRYRVLLAYLHAHS
jgi:hypothetical protein